ncbi:MAG: DUF1345 domain-containing protein [Bacteroidota bacterium]|nr:DUF1345 domain-containing protein [Bacteroidota bacterium]
MDNKSLDLWFSKRRIGWEPLVVLLFIEFLFSRLSDNATFIEVIKSVTHYIFIWVINVIVFGVWYWILDAGGPEKRNEGIGDRKDFLFPQSINEIKGWEKWHPDFIDYLFLAFNTSTTFGPTETMVLSRRVKILMIIQVVASLTLFAVIAARAVTMLE